MDTATPTETKTDAPETDAVAERQKKTRLVRYLLKGKVDENSALLPTDDWAKAAVWDFAKTNKSLHKNAGGMAGFALGAVAVAVAGVFGAVAVAGLAPIAAIAVATLGIGGFFAKKAHDFFKTLKTETLPQLKADIGKKYIELKASEIGSAWQKKKEELAKKKAAEKAKAAEAPKPEVKPEVKVETPAAVTVSNPAVAPEAKPVVAPKAEEKQTVVGTVGGWLLKKALEQASKKKDAPVNPPAAQDNTAPKIQDKKTPPPPKAA